MKDESTNTAMTGTTTGSKETITLTATELAEIALSMAIALTRAMTETIMSEAIRGDSEVRKAAIMMVEGVILSGKATTTAESGS
jgi:hypothetical protein